MGLSLSSRHVYLHQFENHSVSQHTFDTLVRFEYRDGQMRLVGPENPFVELVRDSNCKSVIAGIYLFHIYNETNIDFTVELGGLFDIPEPRNQDGNHPDNTGRVKIICKQRQNAPVHHPENILYQPRLTDQIIHGYAGTEDAILNTHSVPLVEGEDGGIMVFPETSPIISFIVDHAQQLPHNASDVIRIRENPTFYQISESFLNRIRTLFRNTIFSEIRYTTFEDCYMQCPMGNGRKEALQEGQSLTLSLRVVHYMLKPDQGCMRDKVSVI